MSNSVAVAINGKTFKGWSQIRISRTLDSMSTVELAAPFDASDASHRSTFRPFSYQSLNVAIDDAPAFTGTMASVAPEMTPDSRSVAIGAYALPGVLGDCTAPVSGLPLEYRKQTVHEIAETLAGFFDIGIDAQGEPGPPFKKVALTPGQDILSFLADLAKQRNQIMTSNEVGDLVFWTPEASGSPVAKLEQGRAPLIGVTPNFVIGQYYSEITGLKAVRVRSKKSVQFTAQNTLLPDVYRPYLFEVTDIDDGGIEAAVTSKLGRMLGNTVSYLVAVPTWRDPQDDLWAPNTFVQITAPGAMIYKPYVFLIKAVTLRKDSDSETAELELVIPGAFSGELPGAMPWDE